MNLINKDKFYDTHPEDYTKKYNQFRDEAKNFRHTNQLSITDDFFITFGTDAVCAVFKDDDGWKLNRIFNYYDLSYASFLYELTLDNWEYLDNNEEIPQF